MFKKSVAMFVAALLVNSVFCFHAASASAQTGGKAGRAGEVKAGISRLGVGRGARVELELRDRRRLGGYVSEAGEDYFVVKDSRSGAVTAIAYPEVSKVKGNNLSTGAKVAIGVGAAALVIAFVKWAGQFK